MHIRKLTANIFLNILVKNLYINDQNFLTDYQYIVGQNV